jgi:putative intracellular protease/amidase
MNFKYLKHKQLKVFQQILIDKIKQISTFSPFVLTVCTGSALLAKTGLLDGKKATSNKKAFAWVMKNGANVKWNKKARWTVDGKYWASCLTDTELNLQERLHLNSNTIGERIRTVTHLR